MAAVLASGDGAVLTGEAAAALYLALPWNPCRIDIVAVHQVRSRGGFHARRGQLVRGDRTRRHGIAVASLARVLFDLARTHTAEQVARVMHEAEFRRELRMRQVRAMLTRHHGHRGAGVLRSALRLHEGDSSGVHSGLEVAFLALIRAAGLPEPKVNVRIRIGAKRPRPDFHWPEARLIVETDGSASHARTRTRVDDAERDLTFTAAGWRVLRIPPRMVFERGDELVRLIAPLLEPN
jgi:very-short-patch-repair endonuclease